MYGGLASSDYEAQAQIQAETPGQQQGSRASIHSIGMPIGSSSASGGRRAVEDTLNEPVWETIVSDLLKDKEETRLDYYRIDKKIRHVLVLLC